MKKRVGFKQKAKSLVNKLLLGTAIFHLGTQAVHTGHNVADRIDQSEIRKQFEKETGFPIYGYTGSIEQEEERIKSYIEIIAEEKKTRDFKISQLKIEDQSYLKKSIPEQVASVFSTGYSGLYDRLTDDVVLTESGLPKKDTLRHEIKHAKTFEIEREHPGFFKEWAEISRDENGASQYLPLKDQIGLRIKGLEKLVKREKKSREANLADGFVSNYARTNVYEDTAEFGEEIETRLRANPEELDAELRNPANIKLAKKLKLAIKHGLVPKETEEVLHLIREFRELVKETDPVPDAPAYKYSPQQDKYLEESRKFLETYPDSVLQADIRRSRAEILYTSVMLPNKDEGRRAEVMGDLMREITLQGKNSDLTGGGLYKHLMVDRIIQTGKVHPEIARAYDAVLRNITIEEETPSQVKLDKILRGYTIQPEKNKKLSELFPSQS